MGRRIHRYIRRRAQNLFNNRWNLLAGRLAPFLSLSHTFLSSPLPSRPLAAQLISSYTLVEGYFKNLSLRI